MAEQEDHERLGMSRGDQSGRRDKHQRGEPMRRHRRHKRPREAPVRAGRLHRRAGRESPKEESLLPQIERACEPDEPGADEQQREEKLPDEFALVASAMRVKTGLHGQAINLDVITVLWLPAAAFDCGRR